jgi:amino acid adenylation domain-containing protein/non-ribosomal peptide synthase protein (TIGR01720 family)
LATELSKFLEQLAPEQRRLFLRRLRERSGSDAGERVTGPQAAARRIPRRAPGAVSPLSFSQQRLWFLDRLDPGRATYNLGSAFELAGPLAPPVLAAAVDAVIGRHESLRTSFPVPAGEREPVQAVAARSTIDLPVLDLCALPAPARRAELSRLAHAAALAPFDLALGPLLRLTLVRLEAELWALLTTMHHIISDRWSFGVFVREVATLYGALAQGSQGSQGSPSPLPALPIQYPDFALWQRQRLAGELLEREIAWWRERLAGAPQVLDLPADRTRPAVLSSRGGSVPLFLSGELTARLKALTQRQGTTLFMALLAAFNGLLCRYTGQRDILVGTPIAGRTQLETEGLIGFLINTLVLRTDLAGDPSLRELLARVQDWTRSAYAHQDLPFEKLVEELQPERDLSRTPLFQVVFAFQNTPEMGVELPGLTLRPLPLERQTAKFDLTFELGERAEGIGGTVEYNRDLFDAATVRRLVRHLENLLRSWVDHPALPLSSVSLLSDAERQQSLVEWNDTSSPLPPLPAGIHELFERQAARRPDAVAVVSRGGEIRYGELDRSANRLAHHLRRLKVGPGSLVAVFLERSAEMVPALLGILKAGAAYLPLEVRYPEDRLRWILAAMDVRVLLTGSALLPRVGHLLPELPLLRDVVCLDREPEDGGSPLPAGRKLWRPADLAGRPGSSPGSAASGDDLAYVIFTSGSTGRPKGVMVRHRPVLNLLDWVNTAFRVGPADRVLFITSLCFDLSVYDVFGLLAAGGSIRVVSQDELEDPRSLAAILGSEPITFWDSAPAALAQLAPFLPQAAARGDGGNLRLVFLSGDWVPLALPDQVRASFPGARVIALGGATEATVWSNSYPVETVDPRWKSIPYGRPIQNARYYVLDGSFSPSPIGIPGDLYIGGECLSDGYAAAPLLTARQYLPDPFAARTGAVMYRTGDRARFGADGTIEFLGRLDEQVKVRGFRIELGEIEAALDQHPAVREVIATVREDRPGDRRLVAYVVPRDGLQPAAADLAAFVRVRLPDYMVPASFVCLPALPLTANGKVDRKALPAPEWKAEVDSAPRTPVEELLAAIFCEVLAVERVGVEDSFFDLGGHSLLATQLTSRVRETLGVELPLPAVFEAPTVAGLGQVVEQAMRAGRGLEVPKIEPVPRSGVLPLSFGQQRLWFLDQLQPGSPAYNIPTAVRLDGRLDAGALAAALREVVRRHETLRTTFESVAGEPRQVIARDRPLPLPRVDLRALPAARREEEVRGLARAEAWRPFDLARGPLFRTLLLASGEEEHALLLTFHHIVSDGWSMGILVRELGALYPAFCAGLPSPLPDLPVQYADYAFWQRRWLAGEVLAAELAYWRGQLAAAPPLLELSLDRPRPAVQTFRGASRRFVLPAELSRQLQALSRAARNATPFMTLLAAFQALLGRLSGQLDIVVGTPVAGRNHLETEGLIGFFVNTVVLCTDLGGNPSFRELLERVRVKSLGAFTYADLPFEKLVDELQPERNLSHSPLFQVLFTLQSWQRPGLDLPELRFSQVEMDGSVAKFDLTLSLEERPFGLAGGFQYNSDLFDPTTVARFAAQYESLLEAAAANPGLAVTDLPLLAAAERHQVLAEWNDTDAAYPTGVCLHELIAAQAARTPDALAAVCAGESLTYRELEERAGRLAERLIRLGVLPDGRVGVLLERSLEMIVALLGTLKAGAAYLPLDPSLPAERLALVIESAGAGAVLVQERLAHLLPGRGEKAVVLDGDAPESFSEGREGRGEVGEENLAYVIYTSGSTGTPKGVMISHAGIVNRLLWMQESYRLTAADRVLQKTPFGFDVSVWEFFWPLLVGARLVFARPEGHKDPAYLAELIAREGITTLHFVPSMLQAFLEAPGLEPLPSLRRVMASGEALPPDLVRRFFQRLPGVELHNLYGPTEASVDVSFWPCVPEPPRSVVPIGRPIANLRLHVVDRELAAQPVGVAGELLLGGVGLARGYLGRPELTAAAFVPDPFASAPGRRLYRTGDLTRLLPDGGVEYLGRIDHQVKVRGFRIELGEIEVALAGCPGVRQAAAAVRRDPAGGKSLVAYAVPAVGETLDPGHLRSVLRDTLPDYMVPGAVILLDALPLTSSGKIDRKALPEPDLPAAEMPVGPRTPFEELLAAIFAEVLRIENVNVEASFFDLGGHSLLATQLVSRIRETFGVEVALPAIFESPAVAGLARVIEQARRTGEQARVPRIEAVPRSAALPLSFAQQRLWFLDQLQPGSPAYNIPVAVQLEGHLVFAALAAAMTEVVRRHEVLRTTFTSVAGEPRQVIAPSRPVVIPRVDLSALAAPHREAEARRLAREEARSPFDLERGPLVRVLLVATGEEDGTVFLTLHHIVSDGWSMSLLVREIGACYEAFAASRPPLLPRLEVQYADYAAWQRSWLSGDVLAAEIDHWRRQLEGAPSLLDLPTDRPRPAIQTFRGASRSFALPGALSRELQGLARRQRATLYMALLASFQTLLSRYSGQLDISIGTPIAGRGHLQTESLIGCFVNTLVLRTDHSGDPSFLDLLQRVKRAALEAFAHPDLQFEKLVDELQPERDLSHTPLFQAVFSLQNWQRPSLDLPGLTLRQREMDTGTAKFDLILFVEERSGSLGGSLHFNTDLFDATTIARMAGHLEVLLHGVARAPEERLSDLALLREEERAQVVEEWNDTALSHERVPLLQELFEASVQQTPTATAVVSGGTELTYAELNRRANRLAHHLRGVGVGPGKLAAVLLDRSAEMVVALLGIVKAGGAYVPLETRAPAERMQWILDTLGISVLVGGSSRLAAIAEIAAAAQGLAGLRHVVCLDLPGGPVAFPPSCDLWLPADLARQPEHDPEHAGSVDDLAYIIFTSGSTGRPKGVMVRHRPVVNLIDWVNRSFAVGPADRVLFIASLGFDLSVYDVFGLLAAGGSIRVASREELENPELLARILATEPITLWDSAPAALQQIAPLLPHAVGRGDGGNLRLVLLSGDWIPLALPDQVRESFPAARVIALGGATEATVWSNFHPVAAIDPGWKSIPYGRPIQNARYYVLDGALSPCPIGVPGDLYIGGECLSDGYAAAPLLTARQYLPDPFAGRTGAVMYSTGDRARFGADGTIEFLGRLDAQVKIRGFRIELGEIEVGLLEHPAVREAVALVREDRPGDRRLVAYVVAEMGEAEAPPAAGELRAFLKERLPEYMVPAAFVLLAAMPVTANGKLDRKALPAPELSDAAGGAAFVAPRNAAEETLAGIWRDVLRREQVSVDANFFELGGDSILSIQVISRAARAGLALTPRQLFENPTVAGLAAVAGVGQAAGDEAGRRSEVTAGPVPLTPIQRWFFAQEMPHPEYFNQALLLEMWPPEGEARIDPAVLRRAVAGLLEHHSAFSLRFEPPAAEQPEWRQVSGAAITEPPFTRFDLAALPEERRRPALEEAAASLQASLDLAAGPLLRVALFGQGGEAAERLLLVSHHLVMDGVSWRVLLEDLEILYRQLARGEAMALLPPTASFQGWAARLAEDAASPAAAAAEAYWLARLSPPPSPLPVDFGDEPHARNTVASARSVTVLLEAEETRALLQDVPRAYRTRIDDVLLTALAEAFAGWTGSRRLLVDLEGHGRGDLFADLDLSRTVGWFTTLAPVLLDLRGAAGPGEALKAVKEQLREVPRAGAAHGLPRSLPRAEVVFNYLGQLDQAVAPKSLFRPAAESPGPWRDARQPRAHLLEINGGVSGGQLRMGLRYSEHRHRRESMEELAERFAAALRGLIAHCLSAEAGGFTPSDFPLAGIGQAELDRLAAGRRIEDLYPASPVQQGMLFHALQAPGSGVYVEQLGLTLGSELDAAAFARTWQRLVARHPILRTSFAWEGLDRPLQVVHPDVVLPWDQDDWSALSPAGQGESWTAYLAANRQRGFDLAGVPLSRCALIGVGEEGYRFLWSHHHVLLDGWSLPLLLRELFALYEGELKGEEVRLAPVRPYRDYVAWLESQDLAAAEAFWRHALAGFLAPTPLAVDRSMAAPAAEESHGTRQASLSADRAEALRAFGRRHQLTVNTVVQGAWAALLQRYSGEEDVVFGAVTSGRSAPVPGIEAMVGLFINTLPVRVSGSAPLAAWLTELQERQAEARQYEHTPLSRVQGWSQVPRGLPLFESILAFENYPVDHSVREQASRSLHIGGAEAHEQTNYPLTIVAVPGVRLAVKALYDRRRFEEVAVDRLLRHFMTLLDGMLADSDSDSVPESAALPLLSAAERHQIVAEWNDTAAALPEEMLLHRLIERQAARTPGAVAVVCEGRSLTYAELDVRAGRLARRLRRLGVGPDVPVGICAERSPGMMVGLLGILKAGGAYVPLDPSYPRQRLSFMVRDALGRLEYPVVLVEERLAGLLDDPEAGALPGLHTVRLDGEGRETEPPAAESGGRLDGGLSPDHLAYVIYTSGSTGRPKGAMNTHRAIVNRLLWMQEAYGLGERDRVLQKTPLSFDVSVWELFWPLLVGARLVLARPEGHKDTAYLAGLIEEQGITTLHFVPSMLQVFLEEPSIGRCHGLERVVVSGEALSPELERRFFTRLGAELHNLYGPTEAAVDVTFQPCASGGERLVVPIGRPISNLEVHLLDAAGRLVPQGAPGELHIAGVGLARGYLGRPDLTAERFVPHAASTSPGARSYRTGDLACWRRDGAIEYLGRIDHQVKIRGIRIELGEVEAVLEKHEAVRQAVAVVRKDGGEPRLVAYVVPREEAPSPGDLREFLQARLPEAMVPAHYVLLEVLPLLPNGKIDRQALPAPEKQEVVGGAPRSRLELELVQLWEELLGVHPIGIHEDFFAVGGHSLLAVHLVALISERFGRRLPLEEVMKARTVYALAVLLAGEASLLLSSPLVTFRGTGSQTPFFCVHPAGGGVLCYRSLAHNLDPEIPFFGFQAAGIESEDEPLATVEDMACSYVVALRRARPQGPYRLGGWSFGGLVAFEMARQLTVQGAEDVSVVLIDTIPPSNLPDKGRKVVANLAAYLAELGLPVTEDELESLGDEAKWSMVVARAVQAQLIPEGAGLEYLRRLLSVTRANLLAAASYSPGHFRGRVTLLQASEQVGEDVAKLSECNQDYGWSRFTSEEVIVRRVPGNHNTLMNDLHVAEAGKILSDVFARSIKDE